MRIKGTRANEKREREETSFFWSVQHQQSKCGTSWPSFTWNRFNLRAPKSPGRLASRTAPAQVCRSEYTCTFPDDRREWRDRKSCDVGALGRKPRAGISAPARANIHRDCPPALRPGFRSASHYSRPRDFRRITRLERVCIFFPASRLYRVDQNVTGHLCVFFPSSGCAPVKGSLTPR